MRPPGPLCELYVLDEKKRVHPAPSFKDWKAFWRDVKQRTVAHTVLGPGQYVMTFFTGINDNQGGMPVFFKTLVFGGRKPTEHYAATWPDALENHAQALACLAKIIRILSDPPLVLLEGGRRSRAPKQGDRRPEESTKETADASAKG